METATTDVISIKEFTWNVQARFIGTQPRLHLFIQEINHFTGARFDIPEK
jgi:hypothetical protein